MVRQSAHRELSNWLDRNGYHHAHARKEKTPHPYVVSSRMGHARIIESPVTGRPVFAAYERDHHITTRGRLALERGQFALPPGPQEKRRGLKGRLPIDTIRRARAALARASMMRNDGTISARELDEAQRAVHQAWPSIEIESTPRKTSAHATRAPEKSTSFKISTKAPSTMTASEINKELDKLHDQDSTLGRLMINAGRGHERPSEYLKMTDPLALELRKNAERRKDLRVEISFRYGPNPPSRLPTRKGFGPRSKTQDPTSGGQSFGKSYSGRAHATKQINPEYLRKTRVAAQRADAAWLRGGLDAMDEELKVLRRNDADPVVISEFERLYHNQMLRVLPEQRLVSSRKDHARRIEASVKADARPTAKQRAAQAEIKLNAIPRSEWSRARVIPILREVDTAALAEIERLHALGGRFFTAGPQVAEWAREVLNERGA